MKKTILTVSETGMAICWPQATGSAFRNGQLITYGVIGGGDISGILKGSGRRLEIEIKGGKSGLNNNQKSFRNMIVAAGGIYIQAKSPEDAVSQLRAVLLTSEQDTREKTS